MGASGSATIEFVIVVPVILSLLFTSIDFGVMMIRQVSLDSAVERAAREVRLGGIRDVDTFRAAVCSHTQMLRNCEDTIAIEMRAIDPSNPIGLTDPDRCINREEPIGEQTLPGFDAQGDMTRIMITRVCVAANPFLGVTNWVMGLPEMPTGGVAVVSRTAWVNEPVDEA